MNLFPVRGEGRRYLTLAAILAAAVAQLPACAASAGAEGKAALTSADASKAAEAPEKTETVDKSGKVEPANVEPAKSDKIDKTEKAAVSKSSKSDKAETGKDAPKPAKIGFSAEEVVKVVEADGGYGADYKVSAAIDGRQVLIQTWTNPQASKILSEKLNDHKIDAVLITKKLMDAFPKADFSSCKVRYFDRIERSKYIEILVGPEVVSSFASGALQKDSLLTQLVAVTGDTAPQTASAASSSSTGSVSAGAANRVAPINPLTLTAVLPGFMQKDRDLVLRSIVSLESRGVRLPSLKENLATIEELVQEGQNERAASKLATLQADVLKLQEAANKARAAAAARAAAKTGGGLSSASSTGGTIQLPSGVNPNDGNAEHYKEMRKVFGEYWPHFGAFYPDRKRIAQRLISYRKKAPLLSERIPKIKTALKAGQELALDDYQLLKEEPLISNLANLTAQFQQMEIQVINNSSAVDAAVKQLNKGLGLSELPRDADYKMVENQNREWLQGGYK